MGLVSLVVIEAFLCFSVLPVLALPFPQPKSSTLRPAGLRDGGRIGDLTRALGINKKEVAARDGGEKTGTQQIDRWFRRLPEAEKQNRLSITIVELRALRHEIGNALNTLLMGSQLLVETLEQERVVDDALLKAWQVLLKDEIGSWESQIDRLYQEAIETKAAETERLGQWLSALHQLKERAFLFALPEAMETVSADLSPSVKKAVEWDASIQNVREARERIRHLLGETTSAVQEGIHRKPISLQTLLADAKIQVEPDLTPPDPTRFFGYAEGLTYIFQNIVSNATVHGGRNPNTLQVKAAIRANGNEVQIRIWDNGEGFDPDAIIREARQLGLINGRTLTDAEAIDLIFDSRFTGRTTPDTVDGQGLAVARDIIGWHHGTITAGNRTDGQRGAVFTITLPQVVSGRALAAADGGRFRSRTEDFDRTRKGKIELSKRVRELFNSLREDVSGENIQHVMNALVVLSLESEFGAGHVSSAIRRVLNVQRDVYIRWTAVTALGEIGDSEAASLLKGISDDENEELPVRQAAAKSLEQILAQIPRLYPEKKSPIAADGGVKIPEARPELDTDIFRYDNPLHNTSTYP